MFLFFCIFDNFKVRIVTGYQKEENQYGSLQSMISYLPTIVDRDSFFLTIYLLLHPAIPES